MDEATVEKIHDFESSDLPERIKVALRFTEGWAAYNASTIDDELVGELKKHFTNAEIVELATIVGIYDNAHKFNRAFDVDREQDVTYEVHAARAPKRMQPYLEELKAARAARAQGAEAASG